jgi:spore photoproduct lyase
MRGVYRPQQIWIDRQVLDSPITAHVLRHLPDVPTEVITGPPPLPPPATQAALMTLSKKHLYLTAQQGRFVRDCPGAASSSPTSQLCCGYMIVDLIYNCNYDCTYCYLQSYVNAPYLTVYANVDQLFDELDALLRARPQLLVRIGLGEFSDSLSLDPLTGFSRLLVPFLRQFSNVLFELRTKSALVDQLLDLEPQGRMMISWSVNPESVVRREEHKTASLAARLQAAQRCRDAGYKIGLHFDPLLYYLGWEADYESCVAQVFSALDPEDVTYMSMGSLRFPTTLKKVVQDRFPKNRLMYAEFFPGGNGKMRYFKPLRTEIYTKMLHWIQRYTAGTNLYLCMESEEVWRKVFGTAPACSAAMEEFIQQGERRQGRAQDDLIPLRSLVLDPQ